MLSKIVVVLLLVCAAYAVAVPSDDGYLIIDTEYGSVQGQLENEGPFEARVFRGIPYAAPPVGELRWMPTQAPEPWQDTLDASEFGPGCPQNCVLPPHTCPARTAEDCLYMNIWLPTQRRAEPYPVMVFIHGGHFEQGSGEGPFYDSSAAANFTNVIVVSFNYRLGALGWLYTPLFPGNMGLQDQIFALQFVQRNIANFGGDPTNVTIYGQSAGGTSVASLMISPNATGLFQRAIIESNPFGLPIQDTTDGLSLAQRFASDLNCASDPIDYACLNAASTDSLLTAQAASARHLNLHDLLELFYPWVPTIGDMVPDHPLKVFMAGKAAPVPMMIGTVSEEALLFIYDGFSNELAGWEYDAVLLATFGLSNVFPIGKMYPSQSGDNRAILSVLATDYLFVCPARAAARGHLGVNPTYLYQFNHTLPTSAWGANYSFCGGHVCHGSELPFVFDITYSPLFPFTDQEKQLGADMVSAWSNFATTSSPQVSGWNPYDSSSDSNYEWAVPTSQAVSDLRSEYCDFWDSIGYSF